jgi:ATP adenylyltransferase
MERLWAPWRMEYILNKKPQHCIFCLADEGESDRDNYVLYRSTHSFAMLNRYPYCNGHLLVSPFRHVSGLDKLDSEELLDLFSAVSLCVSVLTERFSPQGLNIGMNLGKAAGAGVDDHIHVHIVPRWEGDTNFMTVVADVRVMPENLTATYERLLPGFRPAPQ